MRAVVIESSIISTICILLAAGCGGGQGKGVGEPCSAPEECASGVCLQAEGICSVQCLADADCPGGTSCQDLGAAGKWCLPDWCQRDCASKECGPDGCGGTCGTCTGGKVCDQGSCVCAAHAATGCHNDDVWWFDSCGNPEEVIADCPNGCAEGKCIGCAPDCAGKDCGPDGCGGFCGTCTGGKVCEQGSCVCTSQSSQACYNGDVWWFDSCGSPEEVIADCPNGCADGKCLSCTPNCLGRECGPDGCGGTCGTCTGGKVCEQGSCVCTSQSSVGCYNGDVWWLDSCGSPESLVADCPYGCADGKCLSCTPNCLGRECGPDGCGGACGTCTGGKVCEQGSCVCTSQSSQACYNGDVWWLDSCGSPESLVADCPYGCADGKCLSCTPNCLGRECGPDGCGGTCGTCTGGKVCEQGSCVCTSQSSQACYNGDVWWFNSCGSPESLVADCLYGCANGKCLSCTPNCLGRECGPDPVCGSSCGTCPFPETCSASGICGEWCDPGETLCSSDGYGFRACGPDPTYAGEYSLGRRIPCVVGDSCSVAAGSCQRQACLETELVFVLDRSSSMNASGAWSWVTAELAGTLRERQVRNFLGFRQFPSILGGCTVGAVVPLAKQNADAILGSIANPDVASATPIQAALEDLALSFGDASDGQAVVLLTDGDENCGTPAGAVDAAGALWRQGVRVYVIAVTTMANRSLLDQLAQAGGTGSARLVTAAPELAGALAAVYADIDACLCHTADKRCESDTLLYACSTDQKAFELVEECNQPPSVCYRGPGSCASLACLYPYNNGVSCDDADACTLNKTCSNGACSGGTPKCDDGNDCTLDPCNSATGQCGAKQNLPAGTQCDDGEVCTTGELCNGNGTCGGGSCSQVCTWYLDGDGDGFGRTDSPVCASAQPVGYAAQSGDCCDIDRFVYPGRYSFSSSQNICGGYDYNCDGVEEKQDPSYAYCAWRYHDYSWQCDGIGWRYSIPACGQTGSYYVCGNNRTQSDCNNYAAPPTTQRQSCR